jgi:hypothetical protein
MLSFLHRAARRVKQERRVRMAICFQDASFQMASQILMPVFESTRASLPVVKFHVR